MCVCFNKHAYALVMYVHVFIYAMAYLCLHVSQSFLTLSHIYTAINGDVIETTRSQTLNLYKC